MIKHVVMWRLKATPDPAEKGRTLASLKKMIEDLKDQIEVIAGLEVGVNLAKVETAFDIVAVLAFKSWQDLLDYLAHPAHKKIAELVGSVHEASAVVDYEV
jgi:Stress responsive A/B Barrel Domain